VQQDDNVRPRAGHRVKRVLQHRHHRRVVGRERCRPQKGHLDIGAVRERRYRFAVGRENRPCQSAACAGRLECVGDQRPPGKQRLVLAWNAFRAAARRDDAEDLHA
jgi:hypothetical protein